MVRTAPTLLSRESPLASTSIQRRTLAELPLAEEFEQKLADHDLFPLRATGIDVLQLNVGRLCNQTCRHCHVDAGPDRVESMSRSTMEHCLRVLDETEIATVDITGGAPEMNPHFEWLVKEIRRRGRKVMDRCNLTILEAGPFRHLVELFAEQRVHVVSSLPHYRAPSTDAQRGDGVFARSISALKRLNQVGYGDGKSGLELDLVTNPVGAYLPGTQASLEKEWKRELERQQGVVFDRLYCMTNMPISRYLEWLLATGNLEAYMARLVGAFNPAAARGVMCRTMLSVGWDGSLYDCDFNQMLDLRLEPALPQKIDELDVAALFRRAIVTGRHCFGCTAGAGSSCGGATA